MVIFHSYVSLPEGIRVFFFSTVVTDRLARPLSPLTTLVPASVACSASMLRPFWSLTRPRRKNER